MPLYDFGIDAFEFNGNEIRFNKNKELMYDIIGHYKSSTISDKIRIDVLLGKNGSGKTRLLKEIYEKQLVAYEENDVIKDAPLKDDAFKFGSSFHQSSLSKFDEMGNGFIYTLYTLLQNNTLLRASLSSFFDESERGIDNISLLLATSKDFCADNFYFFHENESHKEIDDKVYYLNKNVFKSDYENGSKNVGSVLDFFEALRYEIEITSPTESLFNGLGSAKARQFFLSNTGLLFAGINQTKINMESFPVSYNNDVGLYLKDTNKQKIILMIRGLELYVYWISIYEFWINSVDDETQKKDYLTHFTETISNKFSDSGISASIIVHILKECLALMEISDPKEKESRVKELEIRLFESLRVFGYNRLDQLFMHLTMYEVGRSDPKYNEFFILDLRLSFSNRNKDVSDFYATFGHFIGRIERDNSNLLCDHGSRLGYFDLHEVLRTDSEKKYDRKIFDWSELLDIENKGENLLSLDLGFNLSDGTIDNHSNLSAGQQMTIFRFVCIYHDLIEKKEKYAITSFIVIIDEPGLHLHPERSKVYIKRLLDLYTPIIEELDIKIHFIIATHSSYIVSDIPIENIVFLENGKNVSDRYKGKGNQTFANTTYNIVSEFLGATDTMGSLTKEILSDYVKEMKKLLGKLYSAESCDVDTTVLEKEIKLKIEEHKKKYHLVLEGIGDPYLKEHLLHLY